MGKRKAKSKPPPKKAKAVLPSNFTCLFCNHENAVTVKMDRKSRTGELWCKVCGQSFQTTINALSDPVDIYSDWVDACDSVAKEAAKNANLNENHDENPGSQDRAKLQSEGLDDLEDLEPDEDLVDDDDDDDD